MGEPAKILYSLEIRAGARSYELLAGLLSQEAPFGWEEAELPDGAVVLTIRCENAGFLERLSAKIGAVFPDAALSTGTLEQKDWLEAWKEFFQPLECGNLFVVLPPWLGATSAGNRKRLIINPKSAFGTGHHASTALCLTALSGLAEKNRLPAGGSFLDLGCGSGILAIAACLCGMRGLALDIDELAVENARENAQLNAVRGLQIELGDVAAVAGRTFDLVMANILARPLIEMAPPLCRALRPGGCMILSGILDSQADQVERAYKACGAGDCARLAAGEWRALVWSPEKQAANLLLEEN